MVPGAEMMAVKDGAFSVLAVHRGRTKMLNLVNLPGTRGFNGVKLVLEVDFIFQRTLRFLIKFKK